MYKVILQVKPYIEDIEAVVSGMDSKNNKGGLYALLMDIGYSRLEIASHYNLKPNGVSSAASRFKGDNPSYRVRNPIYLSWKQNVYEECVKKRIINKEFYKLDIRQVFSL